MRQEKFKTVCSNDPEIDTTKIEASTMGEFLRERSGLDTIRHAFTPRGPVIFNICEIPQSLWDWVDEPESEAQKYKRAFMAGVESVENVMQTNGTPLPSVSGTKTLANGTTQVDIMQERDLQYFSPAERLEIGSVAYTHSFLHRKIVSCFRLPPASLRRLENRDFLFVDRSHTSQATPNEEASGPEAT
jgi:hypothetical protein